MHTTAVVNYHIKSDQPQAFRFDVDGIVGNLVSPALIPTEVEVRDLRDDATGISFAKAGIAFERHSSAVAGFDDGRAWETTYDEEIKRLLTGSIGAEEVIVFDHTVRIDDPNAARKPARNVHNDYSAAGARQRLIDLVGTERAQHFEGGHYAFVNVWRPVERAIESSPLGFINPASIDADDWMPIELIYPDRVGQILGLAANHAHDWFYLSRMTPKEVAIFNIYDSRGRPFIGHSALDMESDALATAPRKSIETRTLVRYP